MCLYLAAGFGFTQNYNLSAVLADERSCTLGFILRSVPTAGVVQQVLCIAANKILAACNPEIKGKTAFLKNNVNHQDVNLELCSL